MFLRIFFLVFSCLTFLFCNEPLPSIDPKLTNVSLPIDGVLPYFKGDILDPYWTLEKKKPEDLKKLPSFFFTSDKNQSVSLEKLKGKYKLVVFFFAKCNAVCPMITGNLIQFLPRVKVPEDFLILSFSVQPEEDTVEVLRSYKKRYKIENPNWIFLTGDRSSVHEMARREFSADVKQIDGKYDLKDFVHTENVFLVDKENYLRGVYRAKGNGDLERLLIELRTLYEYDIITKL